MDLPAAASAMYERWWSFASYVANQLVPQLGAFGALQVAQEAASDINRNVYGGAGGYNPIGLSQLFAVANRINRSGQALASADPASPITDDMIAEAPWSRSPGEQAAAPMWVARFQVDYLNPAGEAEQGIFSVQIPQVLPSSVGSLIGQGELRIADMLNAPPGTGTPRSGTLVSVTPFQLLVV